MSNPAASSLAVDPLQGNSVALLKLRQATAAVLARFPAAVEGLFVVGSIVRESTDTSDLDVVVVFSDHEFHRVIDEAKPVFREICARINAENTRHDLVLWPSKRDHYVTGLPDVSYIRVNLPNAEDRLDAWCGLAKHTLIHYEAGAHGPLHGDLGYLAHHQPARIPTTEARELFLLSTRALARAIGALQSPEPGERKRGLNRLAKAGLRAAYAVVVRQERLPCNSYAAIHEAAVRHLPAEFLTVLGELYAAKIKGVAGNLTALRTLRFFRHCERAIADGPRLQFAGVVMGRSGESFAFAPESIVAHERPIERYDRFAGTRENYYIFVYFLMSAQALVRELAPLPWTGPDRALLDFFFEEIAITCMYAFQEPAGVRLVVGSVEREAIIVHYDPATYQGAFRLAEQLAELYVADAGSTGDFDTPWMSRRQKLACLKVLAQFGEIDRQGIGSRLAEILDGLVVGAEFIEALVWFSRSVAGLWSPTVIKAYTAIALKIYQAGNAEAACAILESIVTAQDIRRIAEAEHRGAGAPVEAEAEVNQMLSEALHYHGVALHRLGRNEVAQKKYLAALALNPDNYSALDDLAHLLLKWQPTEEHGRLLIDLVRHAGKHRREAARQVSQQSMAHAIDEKRARRWDEALRWYAVAAEADPTDERVPFNRGILLREMGRPEQARSDFRAAMALNPDYLPPYVQLSLAVEEENTDLAIEILEQARQRGIANENALANQGNCYLRKNELALARARYETALEKNARYGDALNGMAIVHLLDYKRGGDPAALKESLRYSSAALAVEPGFAEARANHDQAKALLAQTEARSAAGSGDVTAGASSKDEPGVLFQALVLLLDDHRNRTGSFVCQGEDEAVLRKTSALILASPTARAIIGDVLAELQVQPDDDLVFRPDIAGGRGEPKSLTAVFVPRDPTRKEIFLPYFIYALAKLELSFRSAAVQQELRETGVDPSTVKLIPFIQKVGGARDRTGAVGRIDTVSFSAQVDYATQTCSCNIVFGLPHVATRPHRNGVVAAANFVTRWSANPRPFFRWEKLAPAAPPPGASIAARFRQTEKAVFIPERGLVFEPVDVTRADKLYEITAAPLGVFFPLPLLAVQSLLGFFLELESALTQSESIKHHRIDGLLTRSKDGNWAQPLVVGMTPIRYARSTDAQG